jgi:pimeloyl-ACP methyl ester carboxylesterase
MPASTERPPSALVVHEWFFVGGRYIDREDGTFMVGQMYVEHYVPAIRTHDTPLVMIHGGAQTGTNFLATPDGRPGWLHDFLHAGYEVYVTDQPERGRSGHAVTAKATAKLSRYSSARTEQRFTAIANSALWPQACYHSQWPGAGVQGDPVFDRFYASQVPQLDDRTAIEVVNRDAGVALLDHIGAAILLTHSQSGPFGWLIADARPGLVKAVLAIEPNGPPFRDVEHLGEPHWFGYGENQDDDCDPKAFERPWGITRIPLQFDPPMQDANELKPALMQLSDDASLVAGYLPTCEPRTLPNLAGIPIAIVTAQASYHACYDHCTSAFLSWAGVGHDFIHLHERGLMGNGHMVMLEDNSSDIAALLVDWLEASGPN